MAVYVNSRHLANTAKQLTDVGYPQVDQQICVEFSVVSILDLLLLTLARADFRTHHHPDSRVIIKRQHLGEHPDLIS